MLTGYQAQDRLDRPDTLDQRGLRLTPLNLRGPLAGAKTTE
jgi:hypothetical protein